MTLSIRLRIGLHASLIAVVSASTATAQIIPRGEPCPPVNDTMRVSVIPSPRGTVRVILTDRETRADLDTHAIIDLRTTGMRQTASTAGTLHFDSVPPGKHLLVARRIGYGSDSVWFILPADSGVFIRLPLVAQAIDRCMELKVIYDVAGTVRFSANGKGIDEASVELFVDTSSAAVRRARSDSAGRFQMTDVAPGDYWLRIRRFGYAGLTRRLRVPSPDSVIVMLPLYEEMRRREEDQKRQEFQAKLAQARSRPRRWTCERRPELTRQHALEWAHMSQAARNPDGDSDLKEWRIPQDFARFIAEFRPITNAAECARIARNLDASYGLIEDHVTVYRIGNVLVLPKLKAFADTSGKVHSVLVWQ